MKKIKRWLAVAAASGGLIIGLPVAAHAGAPYSCTQTATDVGGSVTNQNGECPTSGTGYKSYAGFSGFSDNWTYGSPYVDSNMWGPVPGQTQTINVNSPGDWNVQEYIPAANNTGHAVTTYPDAGMQFNNSPMLTHYGDITSSFSVTIPQNAGDTGWQGYDNWFNNWGDEVMIQADWVNTGPCDYAAVQQFGGTNGVPVQTWGLCNFGAAPGKGGGGEKIWKLAPPGTQVGGNATMNESSGTVDVTAMTDWLVNNGYMQSSTPDTTELTALSAGFEICNTDPNGSTWTYNNLTFTANTGSGVGQQQPGVITSPATNVSTSGATINGTVNPEGASTNYHFEYGPTTSYGTNVPVPDGSAGSGTSAVNESATLSNLQPGTVYHYRLVATNSAGTAYGSDQTFTTSSTNNSTGTTLWPSSTVPVNPDVTSDSASVELGTRFTPSQSGKITAIRFYKGTGNTGTHTGTLWDASGNKLGSVTFTGETASGWQQADLPTPVAVTAGQSYVVSYHAPNGNYADDQSYFTSPLTSGALTAPADSASTPNGVYAYSSGSTFPTSTYSSSNYYVDVVFQANQAPAATTNAATGVTSSGATLNGTVNPEGLATTYQFQYGTTTSYGSVAPASPASAGSGTSDTPESASITGLSPNTVYHYRVTATNSAGTTNGSDQTFTTSSAGQIPTVNTNPATSVTSTGATLNGQVNPNGQATTYQFQYGTTQSLGSVAPATPASAGSGTQPVNESANLTGLQPNTTYYYRITASNATGPVNGAQQQFTTSAATNLVGSNTVQSTVDSNPAGTAQAFQFTAGASGTSASECFYVDSTNNATSGVLGIYANTSSGHPGALKGKVSFTPSTGWDCVALPNVGIVSGTKYWLAELGVNGTLAFRDVGSGGNAPSETLSGQTTLPATWGSGQIWNNSSPASIYITG